MLPFYSPKFYEKVTAEVINVAQISNPVQIRYSKILLYYELGPPLHLALKTG
jgi:hypothetical protein